MSESGTKKDIMITLTRSTYRKRVKAQARENIPK